MHALQNYISCCILTQMISTTCMFCNSDFITERCYIKRGGGKYCSTSCYWDSRKGKIPQGLKKTYGLNKNEKNGNWKGDYVSIEGVHGWVKSRKDKPVLCEDCKKKPSIDLANISGEYKRDLSDWKYICRSCHMIEDGRLDRLHNPEHYRKLSTLFKGRKMRTGWKHTEETKNKMGVVRKKWWSDKNMYNEQD